MTAFVDGNDMLLLPQLLALLGNPSDHPLQSLIKVYLLHAIAFISHRKKSRLVDDVGYVCRGESGAQTGHAFRQMSELIVSPQLDLFEIKLE